MPKPRTAPNCKTFTLTSRHEVNFHFQMLHPRNSPINIQQSYPRGRGPRLENDAVHFSMQTMPPHTCSQGTWTRCRLMTYMFLLDTIVLNSNELLLHISSVKIVKSCEDSWDRKNLVFTLSSTHWTAHIWEHLSEKWGVGGVNLIKSKIKYLLLQMLASYLLHS